MQKIFKFSQRLTHLIDLLEFKSTNKFAEYLGYNSPEKILRLLRNDSNKPSYKIISDIANKFENVDIRWLLTGEGKALISKNNVIEEEQGSYTNSIAYIDSETSFEKFIIKKDSKSNDIKKLINIPGFETCELAVNMFGDSMMPVLQAGDVMICKKIKDLKLIIFGEIYLIKTKEFLLTRFIKKGSNKNVLTLSAANHFYEDINIHFSEINFLYIVKGVLKRSLL